MLYVVC